MENKKCEFCGEEIDSTSKRCPYCGSLLKGESGEEHTEVPPIPAEFQETAQENHDVEKKEYQPATVPVPRPLSNAVKVLLSIIAVIPGIGQLTGIIASIIFMSDDRDTDRKSFGKALLAASLILFAIWGMCCVLFSLAAIGEMMSNPGRFNY